MRTTLITLITAVLCSSPLFAQAIDFEDLTLGQVYDLDAATVADPASFTTDGVGVTLSQFFFGGGGSTTNGFSEVGNSGNAGGAGNELEVNNVNLNFNFGQPIAKLEITFGEFGGNVNFTVNGDFQNAENFQALPANVGGAAYSVTATNTPGSRITVDGTISSFAIGGQELWIDNITYVIPEPATFASLLVPSFFLFGYRRRQ
jgi:hypothetical protein